MDSPPESPELVAQPEEEPEAAGAQLTEAEAKPFYPAEPSQQLKESELIAKPEEIAQEWLKKFNARDLSDKDFKVHWRVKVPLLFSPKRGVNCLLITHDVDRAQTMLFEPLVRFLSGNGDPRRFFKDLEPFDDPPALCGQVFKAGEPTYSCRDCGMDPTCVLCVSCFKSSEHRNHRYKISTSGGGGYCDCGDKEAWKSSVFCQIHKPEEPDDCATERRGNLPERVMSRAKLLFDVVLRYCYEMLNSELHCTPPASLQLTDSDMTLLEDSSTFDTFCTVLYNDETHTFELVIQTLTRAVECTKKDAVDFATIIDREGRSIVKCSNFQSCHMVKQVIERQTSRNGGKALKVSVMQSHVVAHQIFAMELLSWMQELLTQSSCFRYIFCDVVKESNVHSRTSILEGIMLGDTQLWKAVRGLWHNLVITGMLKEYAMKKEFARIFTKNYADLMKEFISDDHDHAFSVTALSVQIFTVPTVAHYLIEEHDVIWTIMRTVLSEYEMKLNAERKLEFDRGTTNGAFKRTNFAILDLKYILTSPPSIWTDKLKYNFRNGIRDFIKLLSYMQGMDSVTRQTGQHMEYEPEWESAFNLHIKLAPVISLTLEWCGTDKDVLKRIYRECLTNLGTIYELDNLKTVTRELANHSANCYEYDVASQPVSVHLPLTRLLAGLHLHLEAFGLDFFSRDFDTQKKPCPELIIEPALRTQILISQVHAGMWKRNGYSLLNQLYFYHNVRCRSDMLDKDIIALQMGASLVESNEFLLHILNRFGLFQWAEIDFDDKPPQSHEDDTLKYTIILVEEFFGLIITIVSARYTPGVAMVSILDSVKKEIIQQLCIDSMTHSNLNKALVENVNYETGLEIVVEELATFRKLSGTNWTYELKPEYYAEYDLYHYHYTREEQSKAEEKQRERRKAKGEKEVFPPPRLPLFSQAFNLVVNVLKSDVLLHLVTIVIQRCLKKKSRSYTDSQMRKVLHLIGHGLNEEIARSEQEEEHFFQFAECAKRWNVFKLLEEVLKDPSLSQHHEMIKWIRQQYNYIKPKDMVASPDQMDVNIQQTNEDELREKKAKAEAAKKRCFELMQQAQNSFMAKNRELFVGEDKSLSHSTNDLSATETMEVSHSSSVALGPNRSSSYLGAEKQICILCQEERRVDTDNKPFVLATFIQRSTVQSKYRDKLLVECHNKSGNRFLQERDPLFLAPDLLTAPMVSCCGHVMHVSCWEKYFEGVVTKERRRPYRLRHPLSFDVDKNEYLCPMCDCINNAVLPLSSPSIMNYGPFFPDTGCSFEVFVKALQLLLKNKAPIVRDGEAEQMQTGDEHLKFLGSDLKRLQLLKSLSHEELTAKLNEDGTNFDLLFPTVLYSQSEDGPYSPTFLELMNVFTQMVYTIGLDVKPHSGDYRQPIMVWQAVAFTITSMEAFHRDQNLIFFGDEVPQRKTLSLRYLVRGCAVITQQFREGSAHYIRSHFLKLLITLLQNPFDYPCILEVDAFTLLISMTFSISSLYWGERLINGDYAHVAIPNGNLRDYHLLRLVYMFHITQVLITGDFSQFCKSNCPEDSMETDETEESPPSGRENSTTTRKSHIISEMWRRVEKDFECNQTDFDGVWNSVCTAMIPFLRCCAKFYEHLTAVPTPKSLEQDENTFENLVAYLGLPNNFEDTFDSPFAWQLPYKWASHPSVLKIIEETEKYVPFKLCPLISMPQMLVVKYPRLADQLFSLAEDYAELINSVSYFICANCDSHESRTPTMCLICGVMLCSQSYCCQSEVGQMSVGACTYHAYYCGSGNGIFLRIRECKVFFLGGPGKGCFMSPPYLDEYGETDQGLRRGNPMTLSKEKYDVYRRIWLQHAIPEEIARVTEHSSSIVTTEWQYL